MKEKLNQELIYKTAIFDSKTKITEIEPVVYILKNLFTNHLPPPLKSEINSLYQDASLIIK